MLEERYTNQELFELCHNFCRIGKYLYTVFIFSFRYDSFILIILSGSLCTLWQWAALQNFRINLLPLSPGEFLDNAKHTQEINNTVTFSAFW